MIRLIPHVIFFLKTVQVNCRAEMSNKAEVITIRYEYTEKDNEGSKTLLKQTFFCWT